MIQIKNMRRVCSALLSTTMLVAPAAAEDQDLEARVNALEAKLDLILERIGGGATITTDDARVIDDAGTIIRRLPALQNTPPSGSATELTPTAKVIESEYGAINNAVAANNGDPFVPAPILVELDSPTGTSAQTDPGSGSLGEPKTSKRGIGFTKAGTEFNFRGYVKVDTIVTDFSGGDLPSSSLGRDFYIPSLIPVGGESDGADFDFNARETRFIFDVYTQRGGHDIGGLIELDFQVTSDGNETVSNSFTPRVRQAYFTFDNWLVGQAWSTFQNVGALPDNLDFIGPTEGTVFIRQPMIRYTKGPWQIAVEQPETEVTGPDGSRLLPGDDLGPDFILRYNHQRDWGSLTLAAIGRALHVEDDIIPGAISDTVAGYGLSASGKLNVGEKDDFRFMATYGEGIGRYVGITLVNDVAVKADGKLNPIELFSSFASYRHFWSKRWRSNLTGGFFQASNPVELVGDTVTDRVFSVHANLIWTPVDKIDVGVEYIYANRRLESGDDGDMNRVQFSAKYSF